MNRAPLVVALHMVRALCVLAIAAGCGSPTSGPASPAGECLLNACAGAADCPMGSRCNSALQPPRCEMLYCGGEGSVCSDTLLCAAGSCSRGVCSTGAKAGESCNTIDSPVCVAGLVCARLSGTCDFMCQSTQPAPQPSGAECANDSECVSQRCLLGGSSHCLGTCDAAPSGPYPAGPYGLAQGSVIANAIFSGKVDPGGAHGTADYSTLPMKELQLGDYYTDTSVRYLLLLGEATWNADCQKEQAEVPSLQAMYEPRGLRVLEVLTESNPGTPATESDLDAWAASYQLHTGVAVDSHQALKSFASESGSFPWVMLIDTSTMKIVFAALGDDGNLSSTVGAYVN